MAQRVSRDELALMIEELDRGEAEREELEEMIAKLELSMSNGEAVDIIQDQELSAEEVADQLTGYTDLDA